MHAQHSRWYKDKKSCWYTRWFCWNSEGFNKLVKLATSNRIKYIKGDWKFRHQGRNNSHAPAQGCLARSSSAKEDLRVLVDSELTRGHLCWKSPCVSLQKERSKSSLVVLEKYYQKVKKFVFSPLHRTGKRHLDFCTIFWALHRRRGMELLQLVQQRVTKTIKKSEHLSYKDRHLGLFSLEKRRLRVDFISLHKKGECKEDRIRLLFKNLVTGPHKKNIFLLQRVSWNELLLEEVAQKDLGSLYLEVFKPCLGMALGNVL